jgi:hypothetical protein
MRRRRNDLFDLVTAAEKRHPLFEGVRTSPNDEPGRMMANEIFATFTDPDGNFVQQFQTTAFDARTFELYLFAYLKKSGFEIDRRSSAPDFIAESQLGRVAIEATTSNAARTFDLDQILGDIDALTPELRIERMRHEFPIRLGGPLLDKLRKRYWELPQCAGLPLVLAIEPFHGTTSLMFTDSGLSDYLYGVRHGATRDSDGNLLITTSDIQNHVLGAKTIRSGFFYQPDVEHISAVVFTNGGTWPKFTRMGYQAGFHRGNLLIGREGWRQDHDPQASEPSKFFYWLHDRDHFERWGEGLAVFHNPNALIPLPRKYFPDAADSALRNGVLHSLVPDFHPFSSFTINGSIKDFALSRVHLDVIVDSIMEREFEELTLRRGAQPPIWREREWLADSNRTIIATVVEDIEDNDWAYAVLKTRDEMVTMETGLPSQEAARTAAIEALAKAVLAEAHQPADR